MSLQAAPTGPLSPIWGLAQARKEVPLSTIRPCTGQWPGRHSLGGATHYHGQGI